MGIFDGFFNSQKNTTNAFNSALSDLDRTRNITDPFNTNQVQGADMALTSLHDALGLIGSEGSTRALISFQTSPCYQFAFDQGQAASDQSAIARGNLNSGATLKDLNTYGQGVANQEYQQYLANLGGLANGGNAGVAGLTNQSNQFGQLTIGQGQAQDAENIASTGNVLSMIGLGTGFGTNGGLKSIGKLF